MNITLAKIILLTACFAAAFSARVLAQTEMPKFKDYSVTEKFNGPTARLILRGEARQYRTRIREAAREQPNFAGHYIVASWGCGSSCVMGAIIDAQTGKVYSLPHTICCWDFQVDQNFNPIEYRRNSRLIIFSGARNEKEGDAGMHFYKFVNNRLVFLRTIKPVEKKKTVN